MFPVLLQAFFPSPHTSVEKSFFLLSGAEMTPAVEDRKPLGNSKSAGWSNEPSASLQV